MVVLSKHVIEQLSIAKPHKSGGSGAASFGIPLIDLSKPETAQNLLVKACEEFGFFKVVNHGVPTELIAALESEATKFFSSPVSQKQKAGPPRPFGYGSKKIGSNGDIGWVEYILLSATNPDFDNFSSVTGFAPEKFLGAVNEYVKAMKGMACEILELLAGGLKLERKDELSRLVRDEESDSVFRVNHYPPCPELQETNDKEDKDSIIGFGEHTDPQIISVLRSNNTSGLQICLKDGRWVSVPADQTSFFVNVGDSLQVLTNGRLKSVRHRVLANSKRARLSMIYFGGPPLSEKIAPLASLVGGEEDRLYKEFTWFDYKISAFNSRLADNRLLPFTL
ncbi:unnamed protein product [Cuscuta campestris]|uniref:Fe2OG dioxygenase domain-containing protein n=1 Tax=Cuscuta campestris TaxID=132261 RepID=A0A484LSE0_9ASTE|nr:unnamed protein product [Cuscuta campestris]